MADRIPLEDLPDEVPGTEDDLGAILEVLGWDAAACSADAPPRALIDHIRFFAADALAELRAGKRSTTFAEETKTLAKLRSAIPPVLDAVGSLGELTRDSLMWWLEGAAKAVRFGKRNDAFDPAAADAIPLLRAGGRHPLAALASAVAAVATETEAAKRSGPGRLREKFIGDVRVHVAFEAARLLGASLGKQEITGSHRGKLADLTEKLWKFITGREDDRLHEAVSKVASAGRIAAEAADAHRKGDTKAGARLDWKAQRLLRSKLQERRVRPRRS